MRFHPPFLSTASLEICSKCLPGIRFRQKNMVNSHCFIALYHIGLQKPNYFCERENYLNFSNELQQKHALISVLNIRFAINDYRTKSISPFHKLNRRRRHRRYLFMFFVCYHGKNAHRVSAVREMELAAQKRTAIT